MCIRDRVYMLRIQRERFEGAPYPNLREYNLLYGCLLYTSVVLPEALALEDLPEKPWATCGHGHKRPHNVANSLYLTASDLENLVRERYERYAVIEETEQEAETYLTEDADIVLVAFGGAARVARSAVNAAREQGINCLLYTSRCV